MSITSTKQPKLSEINLGSTVEVRDAAGSVPTFTGAVVGRTDSFGPSRVPAIHVKVDGGEVVAVTDTGKWQVRVLVDSAVLGPAREPESMVHIRNKPTTKTAVRFLGGAESAVQIIQWAAARASIHWRQSTAENPEVLIVDTPEGAMHASIGDWVVCGLKGEFYPVKPDVFIEQYDIVDASQATPQQSAADRITQAQQERALIEQQARAAMLQGRQQTGEVQ